MDARRPARRRAKPRHVAPFVYTGVGILKPELFADSRRRTSSASRRSSFARGAQGRLFGVRLDGLWLHVGRPESIAEAERAIDRSTL